MTVELHEAHTFEVGKGNVRNNLWQGNGRDHIGGHGWPLPLGQILSGYGWEFQLCTGSFTTPGTQMLQEHRSHVGERKTLISLSQAEDGLTKLK